MAIEAGTALTEEQVAMLDEVRALASEADSYNLTDTERERLHTLMETLYAPDEPRGV